jgi:phosphoribosylformylglycinamidine synthase
VYKRQVSDGGLAVALAETAFAGNIGVSVDLSRVNTEEDMRDTEILYSETQSRIIISVSPGNAQSIQEIFGKDACCIGKAVPDQRLIVTSTKNGVLMDRDLKSLKRAWKTPLDL